MTAHFSVVNKRGAITAGALMALGILIFSVCLAQKIAGGSILWMIPLTAGIIVFIMCLLILISVITAGVDVQNGSVVFADVTGQGGKQPRFMLSELADVQLHNADGQIDPEKDSLIGGRIVFFTTSGEQFVYYPVQITAKQFYGVKNGLFELKEKI
ncbi:MAG: hypothetical protein IKU44_02275 [Firmicutes bacterium]|nr:hypothetical protein [Bacillota bacterium]